MTLRTTRAMAFGAFVAMAIACSTPDSNARFTPATPDVASFPVVAEMLVQGCGSLDCHGTVGRNLRIYGDTTLRWSPLDVPSTLLPTTAKEVAADYASVVALEPEVLSAVVGSGGVDPARLTLVRKARGTENHAGGAVVVAGDPRDRCLTTWLQGHADDAACTDALSLP